ncbi:hypothetical protein BpHYR1_028660 [Brachionus plicatilis]|uniref:Uncharacterized protein n=1 Tax=Brachionus plicatilis TaxID=10195 RepID=A0A3M7RX85_BRAPC|nr:hypothetical protein BpHYR1_028660 [Brachionus plicatilis]
MQNRIVSNKFIVDKFVLKSLAFLLFILGLPCFVIKDHLFGGLVLVTGMHTHQTFLNSVLIAYVFNVFNV